MSSFYPAPYDMLQIFIELNICIILISYMICTRLQCMLRALANYCIHV